MSSERSRVRKSTYGSTAAKGLGENIIAMTVDQKTGGYFLVGATGSVYNFDAPWYGSERGKSVDGAIVAIEDSPSGGYYLVSSRGGVYNFDAPWLGSTAANDAGAEIVGMAVEEARITIPAPPRTVPPLKTTTGTLPSATVGIAYSANFTATGGTRPYFWTASGSLPPGLSLAADGALSGTPISAGTYNFSVEVTDSTTPTPQVRVAGPYSFTVAPGTTTSSPVTITTSSLPDATVGTSYSATLSGSGGTAPYSWAVVSGTLGTGLTLSEDGEITGTPTTSGTSDFSVQVTDSTTPIPETATASLSITASSATTTTPVTITTTSLPAATVGTAYSTRLAASGGMPPYSWAVTSGSLPPGLSLSSNGSITGTPTGQGVSTFTVQVTDSTTPTSETATSSLSITVASGTTTTPVAQSGNWSGYVVGGGPFTGVKGTFTVPTLYTGQTDVYMSEWVGIDGGVSGDSSLIQAGIQEQPDPSNNSEFELYSWWEILPAAETLIPQSSFSPSPGDQITVTIY